MSSTYQELVSLLNRGSLFGSCASLLGWDEQTWLPPKGTEHRANQLSLMAGMNHEMRTDVRIGELLTELEQDSSIVAGSIEAANLREARKDYDRATKLPRRLVEELSKTTTLAQQAWKDARKSDDFSVFQPHLTKVMELKREAASAMQTGSGPLYDVLLDEYESGAKSEEVAAVFATLKSALVELLGKIRESGAQPDDSILTRRYPIARQKEMALHAADAIGFDFDAGRLDETAHPFCSGIGPGDCRLTTRYDELHFPGAFFGTLHEAGHGIYEQGLEDAHYGTPVGESCSLGIHESQSRMWENFVGRGLPFWKHFWTPLRKAFPEALSDVELDQFHRAVNTVQPSLIRVEADEVTYNLHIMLRFELEQALIGGDLDVADLPAEWNQRFEAAFGIPVPSDADGCLQDVHWSIGLVGYFPTYALGNMYAAQFFNKAAADLGDLDAMFEKGKFRPLKEWLNTNIHVHGRRFSAPGLLKHVTGEDLSPEPLIRHLESRFGAVYGF